MQIKRLNYHLYAAIANITLILGELLLIIWALYSTNHNLSFVFSKMPKNMKGLLMDALLFITIGLTASILLGILQLKYENNVELRYAGWLTIFCSIFMFPFFVNITFWKKSGLTNSQLKMEIQKYNIEHVNKIIEVLASKNQLDQKILQEFSRLKQLNDMKLLTKYEMHEWIYEQIIQKVELKNIPILYSQKEILENKAYDE